MAPGSKSRLAILRTPTIFIRITSLVTHFEQCNSRSAPDGRSRPAENPLKETGNRPADRTVLSGSGIPASSTYPPYSLCRPCHTGERELQNPHWRTELHIPAGSLSILRTPLPIHRVNPRNRTCTCCGSFCMPLSLRRRAPRQKRSLNAPKPRSFEELLRSCDPQRNGSRRARH
jgi:hypothetical protein